MAVKNNFENNSNEKTCFKEHPKYSEKKIIIAAGGTGGHIYPALAVAEYLKKKGFDILWIGVRHRMEEKIVPEHFPIQYIDMRPLRGRSFKEMLINPFYFLKAMKQSKTILKKFQAQVVLTMGGFVCAPVGVAAKRLNIPLIVHEQNAVAGWTNELLARFADEVLEAFPHSFKGRGAKKAKCVGNPLRDIFLKTPKENHQISVPLKILVMGGSQGAHYLNSTVSQALKLLLLDQLVEVLHQSGVNDVAFVKNIYKDLGEKVKVVPYLDPVFQAYEWADLIITRSGALSVSEIACLGKPSILVPFPGAVSDHQRYNSDFLVQCGGAIVLDQNKASLEDWIQILRSLVGNPERLLMMGMNALKISRQDATEKVAAICESYI